MEEKASPEQPVSEQDAERLTADVWQRVVELFGAGGGAASGP